MVNGLQDPPSDHSQNREGRAERLVATKKASFWKLPLTALLGLLATAGFLLGKPLLFLESPGPKADVIVILGGEVDPRIQRAAELFRKGCAPLVLLSESDNIPECHRALQTAGVPRRALIWENQATSTKENADYTVRIMQARQMHSAILVTSWYHSRRAFSAFRHFGPDLQFYSMPSHQGIAGRSLPSLRQAPDIFKEYLKTIIYFFWHGIEPVFLPAAPPASQTQLKMRGGYPPEQFGAVASMRLRSLLFAALTGAVACRLLIPRIQKLSFGLGALSRTRQFHHTHSLPVPRLGGIALCGAFLAVAVLAFALHPENLRLSQPHLALAFSAIAMFALGLLDDLKPLGARLKFAGQIVISGFAYLGGIRIEIFRSPFSGFEHALGYFGPLATLVWLVALTNLLNLIDGIDGLAGGIAFILMALLAILPLNGPWPFPLLVAVGMAGALLVFLHYNFPPAKMYLGDGGAYFLGFLIGGLSIVNSHKGSIAAALVIPLFGLAVPILDLMLALLRRWFRGLPLFRPDRKHIHHRLVQSGFSRRRAVLTLYGVSVLFLVLALGLFWSQRLFLGLGTGLAFVILIYYARKMGVLQDWFDVSSLVAEGIELRKETRYANSLGRSLELEAERVSTFSELWASYETMTAKLGFLKVTLTRSDGSSPARRPGPETERPELHYERHEFQGHRFALEFFALKSRLKAAVFEHLTELAAESWINAFDRWSQLHGAMPGFGSARAAGTVNEPGAEGVHSPNRQATGPSQPN